METIKFKAVLPDDTELIGPIRGNAGMVGDGIVRVLGESEARWLATLRIDIAKDRVKDSRPTELYEPEPGCVAIYPDYSEEGDGDPVVIPLIGTKFSIAERT